MLQEDKEYDVEDIAILKHHAERIGEGRQTLEANSKLIKHFKILERIIQVT